MFGPIERSKKHRAFYKMPTGPGHYFGRQKVGRLYGQPFLIAFLMELSIWWRQAHMQHPFGIGDIAEVDGRPMPDHKSHQYGSAVDIFIIHKKGIKRNDKINMITYESVDYDFRRTSDLSYMISILAMRYPLIQFLYNDPQMPQVIRSKPAIKPMGGHDEHIHLTFSGKYPYTKDQLTRIMTNGV